MRLSVRRTDPSRRCRRHDFEGTSDADSEPGEAVVNTEIEEAIYIDERPAEAPEPHPAEIERADVASARATQWVDRADKGPPKPSGARPKEPVPDLEDAVRAGNFRRHDRVLPGGFTGRRRLMGQQPTLITCSRSALSPSLLHHDTLTRSLVGINETDSVAGLQLVPDRFQNFESARISRLRVINLKPDYRPRCDVDESGKRTLLHIDQAARSTDHSSGWDFLGIQIVPASESTTH
jgi:hypothetical protein